MEESTIDASSEVHTIAQTVVSTTIVLTSTPVGDHLITSSLENEEGLASGGRFANCHSTFFDMPSAQPELLLQKLACYSTRIDA